MASIGANMQHDERAFEGLASGDIVLFSSSHPLHRLQIVRTGCPWGQVALILCVDDEILVFESTKISACMDVRLNAIHRGVQWVRLRERVMSFDGAIAARRLDPPLSGPMLDRFERFADETHGLPFNDSKWVALRALRRRNAPSAVSGFFCSELVAEAYQRIGLIPLPPQERTSNNYIPADFSALYSDRMIVMLQGFRIGEEWLLKGAVPTTASLGPLASGAGPRSRNLTDVSDTGMFGSPAAAKPGTSTSRRTRRGVSPSA
jgi:hypothetical protein